MKEKEDALKAQEQQLIEKEDEMTKMTKKMEKMQKVRLTFEFGSFHIAISELPNRDFRAGKAPFAARG